VPGTLTPPAASVNVLVFMVAGFMALLNDALTIAVLGQFKVEAFGGVTEVTVGGTSGLPG